jgi:hypothetical protein
MSIPLYSGLFNDVGNSTHQLVPSTNLLLTAFAVDLCYVNATGAGVAAITLNLFGSSIGTIWNCGQWIFPATAGFVMKPTCPSVIFTDLDLILPRGDNLSIQTTGFQNLTQAVYSVAVYGERLV